AILDGDFDRGAADAHAADGIEVRTLSRLLCGHAVALQVREDRLDYERSRARLFCEREALAELVLQRVTQVVFHRLEVARPKILEAALVRVRANGRDVDRFEARRQRAADGISFVKSRHSHAR